MEENNCNRGAQSRLPLVGPGDQNLIRKEALAAGRFAPGLQAHSSMRKCCGRVRQTLPDGRYARISLAASAGWSNPSGEALVWANTRAAMQVNQIRPRFENGSGQSVFPADLELDCRAESAPE